MNIQKVEYEFYEVDFMSAFNANGKNIELALAQVSMFRNVSIEHLKTVLRKRLNKLSKDRKYC